MQVVAFFVEKTKNVATSVVKLDIFSETGSLKQTNI